MTIYYLAYLPEIKNSGVLHKTIALVNAFNLKGHKAISIIITQDSNIPEEIKNNQFVQCLVIDSKDYGAAIVQYLKKNTATSDAILFRYPLVSKELFKICNKFPGRIIFEHNTKESYEIVARLVGFTIRDYIYILRKLKIRGIILELKELVNELIWAPKVLRLAAGGICVTNEISEFQKKRCNNYSCYTIGNGIDCSSVKEYAPVQYNNQSINLLMLCSFPSPWHGVDRLINGLINYSGEKQFDLHLVGRFSHINRSLARRIHNKHSITFHQYTDRNNLSSIRNTCHVGIGSLALHRIPLKEGSVLKVREYFAAGMPVVIAYQDEDIDKSDLKEYCLNLPADESPIEMERIVEFIEKISKVDKLPEKIRSIARNTINYEAKIEKYIHAFNSLQN